MSLEELLGVRLYVWLGAIALALAGTLLVKYTLDRGLLSPTVRVSLGILFGLALLAAADRVRRDAIRIAGGLAAAGVAVLFASFLAATSGYGLIPPPVGFALMALTAVTGIVLSLHLGPIVAVVGLMGGYLTPYLVRSGAEPHPVSLFGYLLLLVVSILVVAQRRGWWSMVVMALASSAAWLLAWLAGPFQPPDAPWLYLFLVAVVGALLAVERSQRTPEAPPGGTMPGQLPPLTAGLALLAIVPIVASAGFRPLDWACIGLIGAATLVLGARDRRYEVLAWLAAGLAAALLLVWGLTTPVTDGRAVGGGSPAPYPDLAAFLWTTLALGTVFAVGAYAVMWAGRRTVVWSALAAVAAIAFFLVGFLVERAQSFLVGSFLLTPASPTAATAARVPWGVVALVLAGIVLVGSVPVFRRRVAWEHGDLTLAGLATATTTFLSLAVPLELDHEWLAVAWALEVAAIAWIAFRLKVPVLRWLAWPLVGLVALRLLSPWVFVYPIGDLPVLNWLLYGYGVPIIAFVIAAWYSHAAGDDRLSSLLQWTAILLGLAMLPLQVRQTFHPADLGAGAVGFVEAGTYVVAWLVYGLGLLVAARRWPLPSLEYGGIWVAAFGLLAAYLGPVLTTNPLFLADPVGTLPVLNWVLYVYGVPVVVALGIARHLARRTERRLAAEAVAAAALGLVFVLVSLLVRQMFQGPVLNGPGILAAENYAYSLAWILLAVALLVFGILRGGRLARWASLAVMLLAVGKVFLFDTASLGGLYRVFSFLGLGLSLIALGWLYQRFVFRPEAP